MYDTNLTERQSPRDRLITRPEAAPLPTPLDPASPEARGFPVDPRPVHNRKLADTGEWVPLPEEFLQTA